MFYQSQYVTEEGGKINAKPKISRLLNLVAWQKGPLYFNKEQQHTKNQFFLDLPSKCSDFFFIE